MTFRKTALGLAAACAVLSALPVQAQSSAELEALRSELRQLREELNALKRERQGAPAATAPAASPAPVEGSAWGERIEQLELRQKDAVVSGDMPGSFRLPGSETSLRVYGWAEAQLIHDLKGTAPGDDFTNVMEQPLRDRDAGAWKNKTKLTAQTSRFGIDSSTPTSQGLFNTKLEMDFYAYCGSECNRNRLRVRHAYGEVAGFLVGQTWSTFMDLDNLPETVDFNGPIGAPFSRRAMIRYTYSDPQVAKFTVALEDPEDGARYPNLVARVDKGFDWGAVNLRVLGHEKRARSDSGVTATRRGWGVGVGASFKLTDKDLLMGQFARVTGDMDMMYGSNGHAFNDADELVFDRNDGLVLGWSRSWSDTLRSNVVLGMNRSRGDAAVFDNRRLMQAHVGFIYMPIPRIELGAEVIHGRRRTFDGDSGTMSRVDLMGRYSF